MSFFEWGSKVFFRAIYIKRSTDGWWSVSKIYIYSIPSLCITSKSAWPHLSSKFSLSAPASNTDLRVLTRHQTSNIGRQLDRYLVCQICVLNRCTRVWSEFEGKIWLCYTPYCCKIDSPLWQSASLNKHYVLKLISDQWKIFSGCSGVFFPLIKLEAHLSLYFSRGYSYGLFIAMAAMLKFQMQGK